ncbi:MAG: hypothetical protein HQK91_10925 [Nitrospirae bacterium]|nr:hypothetical protein [Nitrospirota bacterium]MBF0541947.1 hypothetical protein [Nitrospirota bacterium]
MIQLDTIVLPDQFYWSEQNNYSPVIANAQRALDGSQVIWEGSVSNPFIDLILDGPEKAFLTYNQLKGKF